MGKEDYRTLNAGQLAMRIYEIESRGGDWKNSPEYKLWRETHKGWQFMGR